MTGCAKKPVDADASYVHPSYSAVGLGHDLVAEGDLARSRYIRLFLLKIDMF